MSFARTLCTVGVGAHGRRCTRHPPWLPYAVQPRPAALPPPPSAQEFYEYACGGYVKAHAAAGRRLRDTPVAGNASRVTDVLLSDPKTLAGKLYAACKAEDAMYYYGTWQLLTEWDAKVCLCVWRAVRIRDVYAFTCPCARVSAVSGPPFPKYFPNISQIFPKYSPNIPQIFPKYFPNISQILLLKGLFHEQPSL